MESNLSIFYNVINTNINKERPWYNVKDNIIYIKGNADGFKYYLEADAYDPVTGRQLFIILSKEKIHDACRYCSVDNFGRLKIRPVAHREYLQTVYSRDSNIQFVLDSMNDEFVAYRI